MELFPVRGNPDGTGSRGSENTNPSSLRRPWISTLGSLDIESLRDKAKDAEYVVTTRRSSKAIRAWSVSRWVGIYRADCGPDSGTRAPGVSWICIPE